jgi:hypothetical protein
MEIYEKNVDYPSGVVPFTRAVIPAANVLVVGGKWIGYAQSIEETQDRPVTPQYEIGSVGPVEILPGQPTYTITINKAKIYQKRLMQVFMDLSYGEKFGETLVKDAIKGQMVGDDTKKNLEVFSLITHNILPIDVEVWELNYGVDAEGAPIDFVLDQSSKSKVTTKYVDCWIGNTTKPIAQGTVNIIETMSLTARKIAVSS